MLESQGYNQTIMFGADADFGGLTTYFKTHGNFNIFDYKAAKKKNLSHKITLFGGDLKMINYMILLKMN
ncbi:hypothetical protein Q5M85_06525 [Paraclostridium bifermentans]|nr:hypothetical protein [Paraclostridium bifermentans]